MKRNTESVSYSFETDSVFRFIKKFANFFMKRNTESVSYSYETDSVFRFIKICKFFYETEYRIRFKLYETDSVFRFIKKFANFFRNEIQNPFHTVLKRILYSVSYKL